MQPLFTLRNEELTARIASRGAEVQSLSDNRSGQEFCWQGDPEFWAGRAPILFPIVGSLWNGTCRIDEKEYRIPKHGFVKDREWTLLSQTDRSLTLVLEGTRADLECFPWPFRLEVGYRLDGRCLRADLRVHNLSAESTMWFQIGGHPSVLLPDWQRQGQDVQGYLRFEGNPRDMLRASLQGCTEAKRVPIPWNNDIETSTALARHQPANALVPICTATFAQEALIFDGRQVSAVQVLDLRKRRVARIASSAPVWLVWAPQGQHAPFLCAEPWYGLCDPQEFSDGIRQRPFIQHAAPLHTWSGWYTLEV